jgi:hypothetical protein
MKHVKKRDFFELLEAQRVEHLLTDTISSSTAPSYSNQYYSEVLMTQRLQRAELEVELYKSAIAKDGLKLLEGMHNSPSQILCLLGGYLWIIRQ